MEFNLSEYKKFILSNLKEISALNGEYLDCLLQFNQAPSSYYKSKYNKPIIMAKLRKALKEILKDKPTNVWINRWLLFKYGYKHCHKCEQCRPLDKFSQDSSNWDNKFRRCKNCSRKQSKNYYSNNTEELKMYAKKYREINREEINLYKKNYRVEKADKVREATAKYRKLTDLRTPCWADKVKIEALRVKAKELTNLTGIAHEVDHIIPLNGKYVSGLNVPENMQILTKEENLKKGYYHESENFWKTNL